MIKVISFLLFLSTLGCVSERPAVPIFSEGQCILYSDLDPWQTAIWKIKTVGRYSYEVGYCTLRSCDYYYVSTHKYISFSYQHLYVPIKCPF